MRTVVSLFVATVLLLSLGACGKPADNRAEAPSETENSLSSDSPAVGVIEPSSLISKEEAERILGVSLDTARTSEQERVGLKQCLYESENHFFQISLTQQAMMPAEQRQTPESLYRAIVENFEDAVKVENVGGEAYFATPGLHILEDGYYILIAIGNLDDEGNREKLTEAGRLAVANLASAK
ncbi:MAG: hypothetical protein ACOX0U_01110 [Oscillospiraceae bacterium]